MPHCFRDGTLFFSLHTKKQARMVLQIKHLYENSSSIQCCYADVQWVPFTEASLEDVEHGLKMLHKHILQVRCDLQWQHPL